MPSRMAKIVLPQPVRASLGVLVSISVTLCILLKAAHVRFIANGDAQAGSKLAENLFLFRLKGKDLSIIPFEKLVVVIRL